MTGVEIIVAVGRDGAIGRRGDLAFHISADLRRFKELTMGYPIIMGRKTFESLPKGALPGRRNIVISSNPLYEAPGAEVYHSLEDAISACGMAEKVFIIGGGQIYAQAMPLASRLHLTRIYADTPEADTFFPEINELIWTVSPESSRLTDPKTELEYQFFTAERKS